MSKFVWETSSLKPPSWWQLHLGDGLMTISIQYRETFVEVRGKTEEGRRDEIFSSLSSSFLLPPSLVKQIGYHTEVGKGLSARQNILSTLPEAKAWGIRAAQDALGEMNQELKPEVSWLLWGCLVGAIALTIVWLILFEPI